MIAEPHKPPPDRVTRAAVVIFLGASLQFFYLKSGPLFATFDRNEPLLVGRALAERGEFADPFPSMPTGPTAHLAPAWPAVLAIFHLATDGSLKDVATLSILASSVLWGACLLALPVLSRDLFRSEVPGWIGVGIGMLPITPITPIWEAVPAAAALAWSCVAMTRLPAWGAGTIAGALAWLNPVAALGASTFWLFSPRRPTKAQVAGFAAMASFVVLPWIVRNYLVFDAFVPMRDNFGLELKMAFRDNATLTLLELIRTVEIPPHPNQSVEEACTLRDMGEVAYMKACGDEGRRWIAAHPRAAAGLVLKRAVLWWFPYREDLVPYPMLTCAVSLLGLVGLWMMRRQGLPLVAVAISFSVPYYLVQSCWRYAVPVVWIFTMGAGFVLWRLGSAAFEKFPGLRWKQEDEVDALQVRRLDFRAGDGNDLNPRAINRVDAATD